MESKIRKLMLWFSVSGCILVCSVVLGVVSGNPDISVKGFYFILAGIILLIIFAGVFIGRMFLYGPCKIFGRKKP